MPNINGYEASSQLKKQGVRTPIVALTANAMKGDEEKCLEAGCADYMSKPFTKNGLIMILRKYMYSMGDPV